MAKKKAAAPGDFNHTIIFTDGACTGNPGPGGWAAIVVTPDGQVRELGGGQDATTNNRMELMGTIKALQSFKGESPNPIHVFTDSTYVIRGITQWIWAWRSRGWKNAEGGDVSNQDLWEDLLRETMRLKDAGIEWKYVRGHTGVPGNERCDEIAVDYAKGRWVDLYKGSILQYPIAIHDIPEDTGLPEMKPKQAAKAPAYSYLSYQGGAVRRHKTWAECERRVKGQSGAKFKKASSAADEAQILRSWGLDPAKTSVQD
jgi:ribonuclease HI